MVGDRVGTVSSSIEVLCPLPKLIVMVGVLLAGGLVGLSTANYQFRLLGLERLVSFVGRFAESHLLSHGLDVLPVLLQLQHGYVPVLGLGARLGREAIQLLDCRLGYYRSV